jgi:uncharacterized protein YuzE
VRITFDYTRLLDHAYLQLGETRPVVDSVEVEGREDIRLDFDEDGLLVGVEFTEATERVALGTFGDDETVDALDD